MPRSFSLGRRFEAFIDDQVATGRFGNASDVVRAGLRLLEDHEAELERRRQWLAAELEKGRADIEAGRYVEFDHPEGTKAYLQSVVERAQQRKLDKERAASSVSN